MSFSVQCPVGHSVPLESSASGEVVCPECGVRFSATGDDDAAATPRGLWGVMSEQRESDDDASSAEESADRTPGQPASRGLWSVMGNAEQPGNPLKAADASSATSSEPEQG
ncbi:MAG: hypothetical protein ACE5KM_17835, partial [Planctomycetaceae bacterium]